MSLHVDERNDGFALFIDGDLQFDTSDEALYHESLALPALCLAQPSRESRVESRESSLIGGRRSAVGGRSSVLRVLICGGGDGLALRECLRFPGVTHVDLVDYDPDVVALGRTRFAEINGGAFEDPRVSVYFQDAWEFLPDSPEYHVILCDFTVPRRPDEARIFTREWYARVRQALAPGGMIALNAVSPQATPEAFWCLRKTVRATGLSTLPYRVCIPSFRAQGYGAWAFLLAADRPLRRTDLRALVCPVPTRQTDLTRLWRGARFTAAERALERRVPVHTLENGCLLPLLLNPGVGCRVSGVERPTNDERRTTDNRRPTTGGRTQGPRRLSALAESPLHLNPQPSTLNPERPTPDTRHPTPDPFDLDPLLRAVPITHPYHTREMVETLAEQVVGTLRTLDLRRLVAALLRRTAQLPAALVRELRRLREFLRDHTPDLNAFRSWGYRLFAALVITMTIANAVAPDNAFAKGSSMGHASMSRGYFHGGFGGGRGGTPMPVTARGVPSVRMTGSGFRRGYGRSVTDIYGNSYRPRVFIYCGGGIGHHHPHYVGSGQPRPASLPPPEQHNAVFAADEDMIVLDNGDIVVTLSDSAYLLVTGNTVALMSDNLPDPLLPVQPDPAFFQALREQIADQQVEARAAARVRRDWLGWVGWTSALFPVVADDRLELSNLEDLNKRLETARGLLGDPGQGATAAPPPTGSVELFVGAYLLPDGRIGLRGPDRWVYTDGKEVWDGSKPTAKPRPCPPQLAVALKSILLKLQKELAADIIADDSDLREILTDRAAIEKDMAEYRSIQASYSYDPSYTVDYGTDEIPVGEAISRTQNDLNLNQQDYNLTITDRTKSAGELERINTAAQAFGR